MLGGLHGIGESVVDHRGMHERQSNVVVFVILALKEAVGPCSGVCE